MATTTNDTRPTLTSLMRNPGDQGYYSQGWINTVEDHLAYFQDDGNGTTYSPTGMERNRYKYRFFSFLRDIIRAKRPEHYYVIMRANNMTSPMEFDESWDFLIIPSEAKIQDLYAKYNASVAK